MSALDLQEISACLQRIRSTERRRKAARKRKANLLDLPDYLQYEILCYLDVGSRRAAFKASNSLANAWAEYAEMEELATFHDMNDNQLTLDCLPADAVLLVFKYLDVRSLGRVAQVCRRFMSLAYSDCLWIRSGKKALASNQLHQTAKSKSQVKYSGRDRVRLGRAWTHGRCRERILTVHNNKYMPRLQLEKNALWVSWGKTIWCQPRLKDGGISSATTKMLRGHKDDVSKFVVRGGMVVSGGRDRSLCGWSSRTGEFLFARRYCHGGEISALDVSGQIIVSGSRDRTLGIWAVDEEYNPIIVKQINVGDRIWSLNISKETGLTIVGTAGQRGTPPLRLFDLGSGQVVVDLGRDLRNGAGMLDVTWFTESTFLSCGYDTCTRLWDTRCRAAVSTWEEPNDEAVYCLETDYVNCVVTGMSRHGRFRVWDIRSTKPLYMKHASAVRHGQSSPVYSLGMDAANVYVALDQSLNHFSFK